MKDMSFFCISLLWFILYELTIFKENKKYFIRTTKSGYNTALGYWPRGFQFRFTFSNPFKAVTGDMISKILVVDEKKNIKNVATKQ